MDSNLANSSLSAFILSAIENNNSPRSCGLTFLHFSLRKATLAALTASSTWPSVPLGIVAITSPLEGFFTSILLPTVPLSVHSPFIYILHLFKTSPPSSMSRRDGIKYSCPHPHVIHVLLSFLLHLKEDI